MKNKQTLCILILLFSLYFNGVNAQKQTAYKKKILEIEKKYLKKIFIAEGKWTQRTEGELFNADADYIETLLALSIISVPQYVENFMKEIKQADKLKTAVDFQREKEEKSKEIRKAKAEKAEEAKAEKERKQEEIERTDFGSIKKSIKNAFEKWNQKGEFEKVVDYKERLKNESQEVFSQISIEQIKNKITDYTNYDESLGIELSDYNSEKESFIVKFKINGLEWENSLNIPIEKAQDFKNNWSDLSWRIENNDWCFVSNSLCPKFIVLKNNDEKFEFPLLLKNQLDIIYSFDNFEINNPYLKGFIFRYPQTR